MLVKFLRLEVLLLLLLLLRLVLPVVVQRRVLLRAIPSPQTILRLPMKKPAGILGVGVPQPIIYTIWIIFMLVKFLRLDGLLMVLLLLRLVLPVVVQRRVLLRAIPSLLEIL
ncbi:hypothetical protein ATW88_09990 [Oenococcus oeni]|nr:hypothetical protein ATW88_09990 [Oenococcus oeni]